MSKYLLLRIDFLDGILYNIKQFYEDRFTELKEEIFKFIILK